MPDLSDLAPIVAAAIIGALFAFHNAPETTEPSKPLSCQANTSLASNACFEVTHFQSN